MLDITGILFSTLMIAYVVVQAVKLDRIQGWFQALKSDAAPLPLATEPGTVAHEHARDSPTCVVFGC